MCSHDPGRPTGRTPRKRGTSELYIEHGHYYIMHADAESPGAYHTAWTDDVLMYPAPEWDTDGGIFVVPGTFFGPLSLTVEIFDTASEAQRDNGEWEIIQEVEVLARGVNLRIETSSGVEIDLPPLHILPGQRAGLRLHARGVAASADVQEFDVDDEPLEFHLLQLWRA